MKIFFVVIAALLFVHTHCYDYPRDFKELYKLSHDEDIFKNVSELIIAQGYPVEEHTVETKDGFLLSVQRIPHGRKGLKNGKNRNVALLVHGLLSSSSDFVINYPNQSLGFLLADRGYDVWLGNVRGNRYSNRNIHYKPSQYAFWNYSFDDMAKYDLPAMIDYALNETGAKELYYIGHSQGTTAAFALLSENKLYNQKIKLFIALAPVTTVGYIHNFLEYLAPLGVDFNWLLKLVGINEFLPSSIFLDYLDEMICDSKTRFLCDDIMFMVLGFNETLYNATRLPVYLSHFPSGSSTKSIIHYAQLVESKKFRKYDYGKDNMIHYNQSSPPDYDLGKITTPVALLWSTADTLADKIDVKLLIGKLNSLVDNYCVRNSYFDHGSFVLSPYAYEYVYKEVFSLMQKYLHL